MQDNISKYIKVEKIAQGSYGIVYKARNKATNEIVALKICKNVSKEGVPISCLRQINIMNSLKDSPYLAKLVQVNQQENNLCIITQWLDISLSELIKSAKPYNVRQIMYAILSGTLAIHQSCIIHRDLKPANIMMKKQQETQKYQLKIVDFGMSKKDNFTNGDLTNEVGSFYYRSPQLLLGSRKYQYSIDIWAIGCIFYQLVTKQILFKAKDQLQQIGIIFNLLGAPKQDDIKIKALVESNFVKLNEELHSEWDKRMQKVQLSNKGKKLLKQMLMIEPSKRITCFLALKHEYFLQESS